MTSRTHQPNKTLRKWYNIRICWILEIELWTFQVELLLPLPVTNVFSKLNHAIRVVLVTNPYH